MIGPRPGTDNHLLLQILSDRQPHARSEIQRLAAERGAGMTVHSRKSDLVNKFGYVIECWRPGPGRERIYQLLAAPGELPAAADKPRDSAAAGRSLAPALAPALAPVVSASSPPSDAGAVTSDRGPRRLSDLDRAAGEAFVEAILWPWFDAEREVPPSMLLGEITDEDLVEEMAEQQRSLFRMEAA